MGEAEYFRETAKLDTCLGNGLPDVSMVAGTDCGVMETAVSENSRTVLSGTIRNKSAD